MLLLQLFITSDVILTLIPEAGQKLSQAQIKSWVCHINKFHKALLTRQL